MQELPAICEALVGTHNSYLSALSRVPEQLSEFSEKIAKSIAGDAPRELTEGGIFVAGYNAELDEFRDLLGGGKDWIESYQRKDKNALELRVSKLISIAPSVTT